jgi:thiol-disulfide isomerase/thioredoxin
MAPEPSPEVPNDAASVGTSPVASPVGTVAAPETTEAPVSTDPNSLIGSAAPPIVGPTGWVNTEPVTIDQFQGRVVLVDFWTYTCVNCIRTLPYLKEWHRKYADQGLVILGVHSPEFEFEKNLRNVEAAVASYELTYPIVQDNDMATWRAFSNRAWPAKYLIDAEGIVRYTHFGEGSYDETEQVIRDLLDEAGAAVSQITFDGGSGPVPDPKAFASSETGQTRELYAGYVRNFGAEFPYIGNPEYYSIAGPDLSTEFAEPDNHRNHFLYLNGTWANGAESVTHGRVTENYEDHVALTFYGTSANVVLDFEQGDESFSVAVTLDGGPVPETLWGADIQLDEEGRTVLLVSAARMYRIIEAPVYGGHELTLSANSDRFSVFAFTFGSYDSGA